MSIEDDLEKLKETHKKTLRQNKSTGQFEKLGVYSEEMPSYLRGSRQSAYSPTEIINMSSASERREALKHNEKIKLQRAQHVDDVNKRILQDSLFIPHRDNRTAENPGYIYNYDIGLGGRKIRTQQFGSTPQGWSEPRKAGKFTREEHDSLRADVPLTSFHPNLANDKMPVWDGTGTHLNEDYVYIMDTEYSGNNIFTIGIRESIRTDRGLLRTGRTLGFAFEPSESRPNKDEAFAVNQITPALMRHQQKELGQTNNQFGTWVGDEIMTFMKPGSTLVGQNLKAADLSKIPTSNGMMSNLISDNRVTDLMEVNRHMFPTSKNGFKNDLGTIFERWMGEKPEAFGIRKHAVMDDVLMTEVIYDRMLRGKLPLGIDKSTRFNTIDVGEHGVHDLGTYAQGILRGSIPMDKKNAGFFDVSHLRGRYAGETSLKTIDGGIEVRSTNDKTGRITSAIVGGRAVKESIMSASSGGVNGYSESNEVLTSMFEALNNNISLMTGALKEFHGGEASMSVAATAMMKWKASTIKAYSNPSLSDDQAEDLLRYRGFGHLDLQNSKRDVAFRDMLDEARGKAQREVDDTAYDKVLNRQKREVHRFRMKGDYEGADAIGALDLSSHEYTDAMSELDTALERLAASSREATAAIKEQDAATARHEKAASQFGSISLYDWTRIPAAQQGAWNNIQSAGNWLPGSSIFSRLGDAGMQAYQADVAGAKGVWGAIQNTLPAAGTAIGTAVGGMPGAMIGSIVGGGVKGISQWVGNLAEGNINKKGLEISSNLNMWGGIFEGTSALMNLAVKAITLPLKALESALKTVVPGILSLGVMTWAGLRKMGDLGNPLSSMTGNSSYGEYQQSLYGDIMSGMSAGSTYGGVAGMSAAAQNLMLGKIDQDKIVAAALAGVLDPYYMDNGTDMYGTYSDMITNQAHKIRSSSNPAYDMNLLQNLDPTMAGHAQTFINYLNNQDVYKQYAKNPNAMPTTFQEFSNPESWNIPMRILDDKEREHYRMQHFSYQAMNDSMDISKMRIASTLWNNLGNSILGFMDELLADVSGITTFEGLVGYAFDKLKELGSLIGDELGPKLKEGFIKFVATAGQSMAALVPSIVGLVNAAGSAMLSGTQTFVGAIWNSFGGLLSNLSNITIDGSNVRKFLEGEAGLGDIFADKRVLAHENAFKYVALNAASGGTYTAGDNLSQSRGLQASFAWLNTSGNDSLSQLYSHLFSSSNVAQSDLESLMAAYSVASSNGGDLYSALAGAHKAGFADSNISKLVGMYLASSTPEMGPALKTFQDLQWSDNSNITDMIAQEVQDGINDFTHAVVEVLFKDDEGKTNATMKLTGDGQVVEAFSNINDFVLNVLQQGGGAVTQ